ncbi:MAG: FHA domain-containing protein [Actinomycetota bacterium]
MPALILNALKILFLLLLFLFLWQVAIAIRTHIGTGTPRQRAKGAHELVVFRGDAKKGKSVRLRPSGHTIGRSSDADVVIDDPYASEFHARVESHDGATLVHDLGSTNGTYVNGRRINVPTPAGRGDTVQIGKTILEVR